MYRTTKIPQTATIPPNPYLTTKQENVKTSLIQDTRKLTNSTAGGKRHKKYAEKSHFKNTRNKQERNSKVESSSKHLDTGKNTEEESTEDKVNQH